MQEHVLRLEHLKTGYEKRIISEDVTLAIPPHQVTVLIGSNGCGKSTLLKTMCRLNPALGGEVLLNEKPLSAYPSKKLARIIGMLPQSPEVPEGISVTDLVSRGRFPYRQFLKPLSEEDRRAVSEAIEEMHIEDLADRNVDELSGGQRQRVWIALALAQETDILFLDEPTTYLDVAYQVEILEIVRQICRKKGITVVMVLHDINLSARYADYMVAMKKGSIQAQGTPEQIITEQNLREVFGLSAKVMTDPVFQTPMIIPLGVDIPGSASS
ncbi:MAG: ABC transporter ATP-binding protein [Lachnospiraceae bacterium]|jgi:iron complex transport system ATP-binding protein|nr:ABC transporter ATP-binding protein [Lachnospiraceae bacterium]MCI1397966.1 ABC transporter ATP-binding protein [Lachnospiraceae bacterium]MCI1423586.1 ABC transporter ATP-binding protein [Lachnospiraceae bacterium]MCI1453701.1 ABC transporter ATP-binding protein [Lachnospiraceae bacterium]MDD5850222.1 ABC transporter ATP-binding protein [Bacillota bacterium]